MGARLQKDGIPPYFYKWKNRDGIRYYDPQNFDTLKVANITATPFFHELLYPFTGLHQRTISKIWFVIEYLLLLIITAIAFSFAKNKVQKIAVMATASFSYIAMRGQLILLQGRYIYLFLFLLCYFVILLLKMKILYLLSSQAYPLLFLY